MRFLRWKKDLLAMMQTCQSLYRAGVPQLLRMVEVYLLERTTKGPPNLMISFCLFITPDLHLRGSLVHQLKLPEPWDPERYADIIKTFASVVRHLSNLKLFEIDGCESWLHLDDSLLPALSSLQSLKEVRITSRAKQYPNSYNMVQFLQENYSPVEFLNVSISYDGDRHNPFQLFRNFSSTLQILDFNTATFSVIDVVYPRLKTFLLHLLTIDEIVIEPFLVSLPNLTSLSLGSILGSANGQDINELRRDNIHAQRARKWSQLDIICGEVMALYVLGLQCHVHHLMERGSPLRESSLWMWETVVEDTQPKAITLRVGFCNFDVDDVPLVVPPRARANVTHLQLNLDFNYAEVDIDEAMESTFVLLRSLPLVFLRLGLEWTDFDRQDEVDTDPVPIYINKIDANPEAFVHRIADCVSSLKTFLLTTFVLDSSSTSVWEVSSADGKVKVEGPRRNHWQVMRSEGMIPLNWFDLQRE